MSAHDKTLYLEKLTVSFDGFKALNELTLQIEPGELRCIIGPNGAGKTTMMDVITGKTRPDSGTARFGPDLDLLHLSEPQIAQAGIGRKFQKPTVFEQLTVYENLELALAGDKSFWKTLLARVTPAQHRRINEVLDIIARNRTHGRAAAVTGGNSFRGGGGARHGVRPFHCQACYGAARRAGDRGRRHEPGAERSSRDRSVSRSISVLAIKGLNQFYGGSHTLWDVDFSVPDGSLICLMGRNGMGKTTLLKCIMGLLKASSGSVTFDGVELLKCRAEERARIGIGYVPQGREIFSHLTVEENLRVGLGVRKNGARTIPERIFNLFPVLKKMMNRRGGDLSGGQQQQLAIGRALVLEPKLLILDEPTEGIQPNIVHEIGDIILRLNKEEGLAVLLVEQKLPFARRVGKDFCILSNGRQVAAGEIGELTDEIVRVHLSV